MYENRNRYTKTEISLPETVSRMYECNLLEDNEREIPISGCLAEIILKPYEIKTYRII